MSRSIVFTIFTLLSTSLGTVLGQYVKPCPAYNQLTAQNDLAHHMPKLLLPGGIAPLRRAQDGSVEKQFGFVYEDFGCIKPAEDRCLRAYSQMVFRYLDTTYGKRWREVVRKDVLFLTTLSYSPGK